MYIFAERLSELRRHEGLLQRDLAEELHISASAVSNYENGIRYPDLELLVQIAKYFRVSTDYLLGYESHDHLHPVVS